MHRERRIYNSPALSDFTEGRDLSDLFLPGCVIRKGAVSGIVAGEERYGKMSKLELARHRGTYLSFKKYCTTHYRILDGQS